MEPTEIQNNANIPVDNDMPEQDVIIQGSKEKLPKFTLPCGERLRISLEQIDELHGKFFTTLTALREGTASASADLKSMMESVVSLSYLEEINNLRNSNYIESVLEEERQDALNSILTPRTWRRFFRLRRNDSQVMLDELVRRQVRLFLERKSSELPTVGNQPDREELLPFEVVIEALKENLPLMFRSRREGLYGLLEQLSDEYGRKAEECKRLEGELEAAQSAIEKAEERARAAEEMLEEFLKDSEPTPDETENVEEEAAEEQKQPEEAEQAEAEPEAEDGEQPKTEEKECGQQSETDEKEDEESEPADEEEDESLSYDGLDEADEQE